MPLRILAVLVAATSLAIAPSSASAAGGPATIVRLNAGSSCAESATLAAAGARLIDAKLRLWRLGPDVAGALLQTLEVRGAVEASQPERTYDVAATTATPDPLQAQEWWLSQIGIDGLTPPGPGIPITIVDSGLDVSHPEFAGRPDIALLNTQEPEGIGGEHGTSVASVIGAPVNGVGVIGIYPQAVLRSWDAARGAGTRLDSSDIAAGILAAARAGRGVINLSLGGDRDLAVELAISEAVASGSLVVAASGNDGDRGGSSSYPAALPHVTTVAATDQSGSVTAFSSRSSVCRRLGAR